MKASLTFSFSASCISIARYSRLVDWDSLFHIQWRVKTLTTCSADKRAIILITGIKVCQNLTLTISSNSIMNQKHKKDNFLAYTQHRARCLNRIQNGCCIAKKVHWQLQVHVIQLWPMRTLACTCQLEQLSVLYIILFQCRHNSPF